MRYYVVHSDGSRYGPADLATLNQWAAEGRIVYDMTIEEEMTGKRAFAAAIPGLTLLPAPGSVASPSNKSLRPGQTDVNSSLICCFIGFTCLGPVSILGIIYANKARGLGNPAAKAALIANAVALALYIFRQAGFHLGLWHLGWGCF